MLDSSFSYIPNSSPQYFTLQNDRRFEELLHAIFTNEIKYGEYKGVFDIADLKPIGADQGIDVDLYKDGLKCGGIQCKWVNKSLSKRQVSEELIKFALNYLLDNTLIPDLSSFRYFFAAPKGFSKNVRPFVEDFGRRIILEPEIEKWTNAVISDSATFQNTGFSHKSIEQDLKRVLQTFSIEPIVSNDLDILLAKPHNQVILSAFWTIKTVIDNSYLDERIDIIRQEFQKVAPQSTLSQNVILQDFRVASSFVYELSNEFNGLADSHIERNETQQIINWLDNNLTEKEKNILLLEGGAGMGKSVIIRDVLHHIRKDNIPILGIKSDRYAPHDIEDLEKLLNLKDSLINQINTLIANGSNKIIVLIDQIDALSQSQSNKREPINTFRTLINSLMLISQARIIVSVRSIDLREDPDLIKLGNEVTKVKVYELTNEQVTSVLEKKRVSPTRLSKHLIDLLKNPSNLNLFCKILNETLDFSQLLTRQDLQKELFKQKVVNNKIKSSHCPALVYEIADKMYDNEQISIDAESFQIKYRDELNYLVSEGIISLQSGFIQFFHQTFYEFAFAKSFFSQGKKILPFIKSNYQSLKIRVIVKMILDFLRGDNPKEYLKVSNEILLSEEYAFHFKHLLITNLCFAQGITLKEKNFVKDKILTDVCLKKIFLESVNSSDWYQFFVENDIFNELLNPENSLYEDKKRDILICRILLSKFSNTNTDEVLEFMASKMLDCEEKSGVISEVLIDLSNWENPIAMNLFENHFTVGGKETMWFCNTLEKASVHQHQWVLKQFELLLLNQDLPKRHCYSDSAIQFEYSEKELLKHLFEKDFKQTFDFSINLIKKVFEESQYNAYTDSDVTSYFMSDTGMSNPISDDVEGSEHHETFYGEVMLQNKNMARENSRAFKEFFANNLDNPFLLIQRLLTKGLLENPSEYPEECYNYITHFGRKGGFELSLDDTYFVRELITASYRLFTPEQKQALNNLLLNVKDKRHLSIQHNGDRKIHYLKWYGEKNFLILTAIPLSEINNDIVLKRRFQELKRKFPNLVNEPPQQVTFSGVYAPFDQKAYDKMSLEHWEQTFLEIDRDRMNFGSSKGSLEEHSRQFEEEVKNRADFFIPLISKLINEWIVKEEYVLSGIEGLVKAQHDINVVLNFTTIILDKIQQNYSLRRVNRISEYLIKSQTVNVQLINFLRKNSLSKIEEVNTSMSKLLDRAINNSNGSAIWYLMDGTELHDFHSLIFETMEEISCGNNTTLKVVIMAKLPNWLRIDRERVFNLFMKLIEEPHPQIYKYSPNIIIYLNYTHFTELQGFYDKTFLCPDELPEIAKIVFYAWLNNIEEALPIFLSMASNNDKVIGHLVHSASDVLKSCESKYWDKSIYVYEYFIENGGEDVVSEYERSFLFLPKSKFGEILPTLKKYAITTKTVSRYYYEFIMSGVKQYPKECLKLIGYFDTYNTPDIRYGNYFDKEVMSIVLSVFNVLLEDDAEENHQYLLQAINIFDKILMDDRYRNISNEVLKEVEN